MPRNFKEQEERVDRLLRLINAKNETAGIGSLIFDDIILFSFQSLWHLRDWVLNDPNFGAADKRAMRNEIEKNEYLKVCADLANGSKHFTLTHPRTNVRESERQGIHLDTSEGIYQTFYYLESSDYSSPFNGMEIRTFLNQCRHEWHQIINKYYLSDALSL